MGKQLTAEDGSVFQTAVCVASLAWLPSKGNGKNKGTLVDSYHALWKQLQWPLAFGNQPNGSAGGTDCGSLSFSLDDRTARGEELEAHIEKLKPKSALGQRRPK